MSSTPKKCYPALLLLIFMFLGAACNQNPADDDEKDDDVLTIMPVAPAIDSYPAWSPDGSTIAFYHHGVVYDATLDMEVHHPDSVGLWFISPDGSNKRMFLRGADLPAWGPRGEWLAFKYGQIYKIKANGDSLTQLTYDGNNYFPAWSSDGGWIAYDSDVDDTKYDIWVMSVDGENKKNISQESDSADQGGWRRPGWSPDGNWIIHERYISGGLMGTEIIVMDNSGTNARWLAHGSSPKFSLGGLKIAFHSSMESYGVWVMDSDGSNLKHLTGNGMDPSWSPDGKRIVYTGLEQTLWIMDADGKNKRPLTFRPKPN